MLKKLMAKRMHPLFFAPPVAGFIAVVVFAHLAITRQQWQDMALLVLAIVSFTLQVIAAWRSYRPYR
jgi:hypothetical protein